MFDFLLLFNFEEFFDHTPAQAAIIVFNLIIIESMLSVDNALVMGTMVMDLPKKQRGKALRYGIFGAYFFRAVCLLLAAYLMQVSWLKAAGGLYLLYLAYDHFFSKRKSHEEEQAVIKEKNWFYRITVGKLGKFWSTVILVNIMDLAFSIDNVFAAVAYTSNIYLVCTGVFIGILAIRFVAQGVIRLLEKFPFLNASAFLIIAVLGVKLVLSFICAEWGHGKFCEFIESEHTDLGVSILTISIFIVPVLTSWLFNFPRHDIMTEQERELIELEKRLEIEDQEKE
jgi:YkoY family integral membrane protein